MKLEGHAIIRQRRKNFVCQAALKDVAEKFRFRTLSGNIYATVCLVFFSMLTTAISQQVNGLQNLANNNVTNENQFMCNGSLSFASTSAQTEVVLFDAKTSTSPVQFQLSKRYYVARTPFRVILSTKVENSSSSPNITAFFIQAHKDNTTELTGKFSTRFSNHDIDVHTCGNTTSFDTATINHSKFRARHVVTLYWIPDENSAFSGLIRFNANVRLSTNETWKGLSSFEIVPKVTECVIGDGNTYRGTVHTTVSGNECQRWDSNIPHNHYTTPEHYPEDDLVSNFCRNMDNDTSPWCYTTDSSKRYEKCIIPKCTDELPDFFYPFGLSEGDQILSKTDRISANKPMIQKLRTKKANLTSFAVTENGLLLFNNNTNLIGLPPRKFPINRIIGSALPRTMAIAVFWAKINRTNSDPGKSLVFYQQSTDAGLLSRVTDDIKTLASQAIDKNYTLDDFRASFAIVATWFLVSDSSNNSNKSSFQVVLAGDDEKTFIVLNYATKRWTNNQLGQVGYDFDLGEHGNVWRNDDTTASDLSSFVSRRSNVRAMGRWLMDISPSCNCDGKKPSPSAASQPSTTPGTDPRSVRLNNQSTTSTQNELRLRNETDGDVLTGRQIDPCGKTPCNNGGTCTANGNQFSCSCVPGFTGSTCSGNINECVSQPCQNGGTCQDFVNKYSCLCPNGYEGNNCERTAITCAEEPCQNGGQCIDGIGGFSCRCATGFTGKTCNTSFCVDGSCTSPTPCVSLFSGRMNCTCTTNKHQTCMTLQETIPPPSNCLQERLGSQVYGYIVWKETSRGTTVLVPCPVPSNQNASRRCSQLRGWEDSDMSNCQSLSETSLFLQGLFLGPISAENASSVFSQLAQVTSLPSTVLNAYDIGNVAMTLQRGLDIIGTMNVTTAEDVLSATGNVLLSSENERRLAGEVSSANALFVENVEATTLKLDLNDSEVSYARSPSIDIFVAQQLLTASDISISLSNELSTEIVFNENTSNEAQASLTLPASIWDNNQTTNSTVQFVTYKMSTLFEFSNTNLIPLANPQSQLIVSDLVLSGAVGNMSIQNLTEPVVITFQHAQTLNMVHCVFWRPPVKDETEGSWSTDGCVATAISDTVTICECDHLTNFAVLLDIYNAQDMIGDPHVLALRILTYIGCGISILGLSLTLISYVLFGKLKKDIPSKILTCLCAALIAVNVFFLILVPSYSNSRACVAVAVLLHYFLLCSLMWMGVEAMNMYIALIRVFNAYYRRYLIKLSLAGWGVPFIFVAVALGLHFGVEPSYVRLENQQICWLRSNVFYGTLVAPFGVIFIFNSIIFCLVLGQLLGMSSRRKLKKRDSRRMKRPVKGENARKFRGAVGLMALLGITWGLAFVAVGEAHLAFSYAFVLLNSTQGFWVFVFHCLLKHEIVRGWRHLLQGKKLRDLRSSSKQWTRRNSENSSASTRGSRSTPVASRTTSTASINRTLDSEDALSLSKSKLPPELKANKVETKLFDKKELPVSNSIIKEKQLPLQASTSVSSDEVAVRRLVRRIPRPVIAPPSVSVAVQTDPVMHHKKKLQKALSTGTNIREKYRIISSNGNLIKLEEPRKEVLRENESLRDSGDDARSHQRVSTSSSNESGIYSDNVSGKSVGNISDDKTFEGDIGQVSGDELSPSHHYHGDSSSVSSSTSCASSNSVEASTVRNIRSQQTQGGLESESKVSTTWIPPLVIKRAEFNMSQTRHAKKLTNVRSKSQPIFLNLPGKEKLSTLQLQDPVVENEIDPIVALNNTSVTGIDDAIRMTKFRINRGSFHDTCP
uniref:Uncharacterized protein LOC101242091 n=1 Tax=Phallusia mammillata TaxID=59560 RepID=A0A6F9DIW3_9ASCI|nr:uncharacterized protein LOC101242091 [Phallusia mammillata]